MRTEIEQRVCATRNQATLQLVIVTQRHRFVLPRASVLVASLVAIVTFTLAILGI
jgi:hypothetical protein